MTDDLFSVRAADARRAKLATRRSRTSDLRRPRDMALAALCAAVAAGAAWWLFPEASGSRELAERAPGPLGRPHAQAKLACASCHAPEPGATAAKSCVGCHGAHPSMRPAHRALAAAGELGCVACHAAHGNVQGVTFSSDAFIRWGGGVEARGRTSVQAPAGATVPLVAIAACARCHDVASKSDPVSACIAQTGEQGPRVSVCLDEHQRADAPVTLSATSACAKQHDSSRFIAWEAAREAARQVPWLVAPPRPAHAPWVWLGVALLAASLGYAGMVLGRRALSRRRAAAAAPLALAPAARVRLPQINTATCLGCYACVDACPFDVLEINRYVAIVARPNDCCGVSLCQQVCPNDSLRITEGEPIEERPRVDEHLESKDAPGVFVAGDLTGLPLIKNAIAQGARAVDRIAATLPKGERDGASAAPPQRGPHQEGASETRVDVVIIGAGPAGISASLRAQELGLSSVTLEQGSVASSIHSFPRNKLVFDQPLDMPVLGALWLRESTKEELLAQWTRIVRSHRLPILEQHRVTAIRKEGARFEVRAAAPGGERVFTSARLVLAIGRRGTPRKLDAHVSAGAEAKVSYALADARSFAGQRVLVVGLGDSAMEAACAIARQPGADVTIAYRGKDFARGKARNIAEVKSLVAQGRLRLAFETVVERVDPGAVMLASKAAREEIANDAVLVLIGGVASWQLVRAAGVKTGLVGQS